MKRSAWLGVATAILVGIMGREAVSMPGPNEARPKREIAVTIDDVPIAGDSATIEELRSVNTRILATLSVHHVPAIGFVNEEKLYVKDELDARAAILKLWLDAGMTLGNHTFSHLRLQDTPLSTYEDDVIRGEVVTKWLEKP